MIFSKKIYKLVSGSNLTLYASDENLEMFVFEKCVNKYSIDLKSYVKSTISAKNLAFNQVEKLNNSHSVVCHGENISIINNEDENI